MGGSAAETYPQLHLRLCWKTIILNSWFYDPIFDSLLRQKVLCLKQKVRKYQLLPLNNILVSDLKMTSFQDIPVEILLKIMTYLDRATLLIASSVSRQWETLIHDTSWQFLCKSLNSNQDCDLRQQLEFYGWKNESHSANECRYYLHICTT